MFKFSTLSKFSALTLLLGLLACMEVCAQVTVTPVTDQACLGGTYVTLADIVISETTNTDFDIATPGRTIILTPTAGSFSPSFGTVSYNSANVNASMVVSETAITVTISESGPDNESSPLNTLTISGIRYFASAPGIAEIKRTDGDLTVAGLGINTVVARVNGLETAIPVITSTQPVAHEVCENEIATYSTESGRSNYQWNINGGTGTSTTNSINVTWSKGSEGNVRVTYTDINGCTSQQTTYNVNKHSAPVGSNASTSICNESSAAHDLNGDVSETPSTFQWVAADNLSVTGESTSAKSGDYIDEPLTNTSNIPQYVEYVVTPTSIAGSCPGSSFSVTVTVKPTADVIITNLKPTIPDGGTTNIVLTSNVSGATFVYGASSDGSIDGATEGTETPIIQTIDNLVTIAQYVTYGISAEYEGCSGLSASTMVRINGIPTVTETDSLALVALYNATAPPAAVIVEGKAGGGPPTSWIRRDNWLIGNVEDWQNVTITNHRVTALDLNENNLIGTLPPQIGNLTHLQTLNLYGNHLTGAIPASVSNLTALVTLNIGDNSELNGPLPSLQGLTVLEELYCRNAGLTGSFPNYLGSLTALTAIDLGENDLTGTIPAGMNNISQLAVLDLSYNQLTGSIPTEFGALNNLTDLRLEHNQLTGSIPPAMGSLSNLQYFIVNDNQLSGNVPDFLLASSLLEIQVQNNELTGLPNLSTREYEVLNVSGNRFTFEDLEPNMAVPGILYAPQKPFKGGGARIINHGETFTATFAVGGSSNVYQWEKNESPLANEKTNTYSKPNITFADMGVYRLRVTSPLVGSGEFTLYSEPITLTVIAPVNKTDSLLVVSLYNSTAGATWTNKTNWLSGKLETWHGIKVVLGRVKKIALPGNNLTGTIPEQIGDIALLDTLDLSNNQISGTLTPTVTGLNLLRKFDISNNQLTGPLPSAIGALPLLEGLFVQKNKFTGIVPASLSTCTTLRNCNLSDNQFTTLPNLSALTLTSLDVSKNKLTFGTLEPNKDIAAMIYAPQDSVGLKEAATIQTGISHTLTATVDGTANQYQWKKNDAPISGATATTYTIASPVFADEGVYAFEVTNTSLPNLKIIGRPVSVKVSSLRRDSLSLVQIYNATGGPEWTNKTGWLQGRLSAWNGVTVSANRVTALSLASNNLAGKVPPALSDMLSLTTVNLSNNKISSLPNITQLTKLTAMNVSGNRLDFASLEPNVSLLNVITYTNQADIGTSRNELLPAGSAYSVSVTAGGTNNVYQWKKNNTAVSGATASKYNIASLNRNTMGEYVCEITNPVVPGLILKSATQTALATSDISGKLLVNSTTPATLGTMTLLKVTTHDGYDTIQVQQVGADGSFKFEKTVLADYQVLGYPDPATYTNVLPTYYKRTTLWEEADTIFVNNAVTGIDIIAEFKPTNAPSGKGVIRGFVEKDDGLPAGRTMKAERIKNAGVSVRRVENTGRTKEIRLILVAYVFTDANGEFEIPNLPEGEYRLNIQYPGFPMDEDSYITIPIGPALKSQVQVEAHVEDGKITVRQAIITGIAGVEQYEASVYPNPTSSYINIRFGSASSSRSVKMIDLTGREVQSKEAAGSETSLDIRSMSPGNYLLNVHDKGSIVKTLQVIIK